MNSMHAHGGIRVRQCWSMAHPLPPKQAINRQLKAKLILTHHHHPSEKRSPCTACNCMPRACVAWPTNNPLELWEQGRSFRKWDTSHHHKFTHVCLVTRLAMAMLLLRISSQRLKTILRLFYVARALFSSEKFLFFGTVSLSFVCDKYYPIMN